jgi:prepilin-type N-terminal cleavage/methylation domain-containing protein
MTLKKRIKQAYGFSLLELVVVLAVTASMSVVALPSFVKHAGYRVADNHIDAVLSMHHALRTYYDAQLEEGALTSTTNLFPNGCATLVNENILPQIPLNAWGGTFDCSMQNVDDDPYANLIHKTALLKVTNVPENMVNYLQTQIPLTSCIGSTCTSTILPPNAEELPERGCTIPYAANYDPNASVNHDDCVCYNMKFRPCGSSGNSTLSIGLSYVCKKIDGVPVTPADLGRIVDVNSTKPWSSSPNLWEVSEVWAVPFILAYNGGTGNYMNNFDSYPAGCSQ